MFNAALSVGLSCVSVFKLAAEKFIGKLLETFHLVIVIFFYLFFIKPNSRRYFLIFHNVHYLTNCLWLSLIVHVTACITKKI